MKLHVHSVSVSIPASDFSYPKTFNFLISLGKKWFGVPAAILIKPQTVTPCPLARPSAGLWHTKLDNTQPLPPRISSAISGAESAVVNLCTWAPRDPRSDPSSYCGLCSKEQMMLTQREMKGVPQSQGLLLLSCSPSTTHCFLFWYLITSHEPHIQLSEGSP